MGQGPPFMWLTGRLSTSPVRSPLSEPSSKDSEFGFCVWFLAVKLEKRGVRTSLRSSANSWDPSHKPQMLITIPFTCNTWGTKQFHISWYYLPSKAFSLRGKWKRSCAVGPASESRGSLPLAPRGCRAREVPPETDLGYGEAQRLPWPARDNAGARISFVRLGSFPEPLRPGLQRGQASSS